MEKLIEQNETIAFLGFLDNWIDNLEDWESTDIFSMPENTAIFSVDMIKGFCNFGPLSGPRVAALIDPVTDLMTLAWDQGVRHIVIAQDTHEPDAVEFGSWPPHCVRGTAEAETIEEFKQLPFFEKMVKIEKNSINAGINDELGKWLQQHPSIDTCIIVGDCTDLCVYQLAMYFRLEANERQLSRQVIVPANCVDTYEMTVDDASELGVLPHPGKFTHEYFLYHMALNGVEVCKSIN
jgi:nicotinamidase-related amidase